jgi:hypothetical protein
MRRILAQPIRMCGAADVGIGQNCVAVSKRSDFAVGNQVYFTSTTIQRGLSSRALLVSKFQDRISLLHVCAGIEEAGNN